MKKKLIIATRSSQLALWQANFVGSALKKRYPELDIELLALTTSADQKPYLSLAESGGKGLFVKELEEALLVKKADIAVHSLKDMPVELPANLNIAAICKREQPWDVMVSTQYESLDSLPTGATVGTSSLRRQSQLLHLRPDIKIEGLRGNINTRLTRLDSGEYDAIILAAAGLIRLNFLARITATLASEQFLPAAGQGALAIECRSDDEDMQNLVAFLNDDIAAACTQAERSLCKALQAGCQTPVAAFAEIKEKTLRLRGLVGSTDGKTILRAELTGSMTEAESIGKTVATDLLDQGAEKILKSL